MIHYEGSFDEPNDASPSHGTVVVYGDHNLQLKLNNFYILNPTFSADHILVKLVRDNDMEDAVDLGVLTNSKLGPSPLNLREKSNYLFNIRSNVDLNIYDRVVIEEGRILMGYARLYPSTLLIMNHTQRLDKKLKELEKKT